MPHIFISAMPQDQALTDEIRLTLQKSYDQLEISLSTALDAAAAQAALTRADLILYLASPEAQASAARQAELSQAARLQKPLHTLVVRGSVPSASPLTGSVFDLTDAQTSNKALFGFYSAINTALRSQPPQPSTVIAEVIDRRSRERRDSDTMSFDDGNDIDFLAPHEADEEYDAAETKKASNAAPKPAPPPPAPSPQAPAMPLPAPPARPVTPPANIPPVPAKSRSRFPLMVALGLVIALVLIAQVLLPNLGSPGPALMVTDLPDLTATPSTTLPETADGVMSPLILVIGGVLIVLAGVMIWHNRPRASAPALTDKPLVFISYRRDPSWGQARCITNSLKDRQINVFFDVDSINEGKFAEVIKRAIENCDYFVPILAPVTLESEWVRQEIIYALQQQKPIIPLLVDGFQFDEHALPAEVSEIATHNAINVTHEFYDAAIERLTTRFIRAS